MIRCLFRSHLCPSYVCISCCIGNHLPIPLFLYINALLWYSLADLVRACAIFVFAVKCHFHLNSFHFNFFSLFSFNFFIHTCPGSGIRLIHTYASRYIYKDQVVGPNNREMYIRTLCNLLSYFKNTYTLIYTEHERACSTKYIGKCCVLFSYKSCLFLE